MRTEALSECPDNAVTSREACDLAGIVRQTLVRWVQAGLPYWREPEHPHRYFYDVGELQAMKRRRSAARILVKRSDDSMYDYG